MISRDELLGLISDLESNHIERTRSTWDADKFSQAVAAFSNDIGGTNKNGYILIGVEDNGKLSALRATDEQLKQLGELRSHGNILPQPVIEFECFHLDGGDVIVLETKPHPLPPVAYKGRVYIRLGPRKAIASREEEALLSEKRVSSARSFDALPCIGSSLNDLALDLFTLNYRHRAIAAEVIAENERSIEHQLASLRFFDLRRGEPTNAAILLFGKNPTYFLPGAYVQFLRIRGNDVVEEKSLSGDLIGLLHLLDALIDSHIQLRPEFATTLREMTLGDYPKLAIRELAINAILHRNYESNAPVRFYWYDDRIEIDNPGGLYGQAAQGGFPERTDYRNPTLAEALKNLGYANRFGRGVIRAQEALAVNGNPPAEFDTGHAHFKVTVRARQ